MGRILRSQAVGMSFIRFRRRGLCAWIGYHVFMKCHLLPAVFVVLGLLYGSLVTAAVNANPAADAPAKAVAPAISMQSPLNHQVFQRKTLKNGTITLRGSAEPATTRLEMQWTGQSAHGPLPDGWHDIKRDANGRFDREVSLPAGGWYRLELRLTTGDTQLIKATIENIGVGEVFVVAGQSNSSNHGSARQQPKSGFIVSFDGKQWAPANDPQPGVQDGSAGGSFIPAFGDALYAKYQVPIGIASTGQGATSVRQWLPKGERMTKRPTIDAFVRKIEVDGKTQWESTGQLYEGLMTRVEKLGPQGCRAILWHQGESDAGQERGGYGADKQITGDDYQRYMKVLIQASQKRAGWKLPWFVAQATYHSEEDASDDEFRAAQAALWRSGLALEGPDTDALKREYRDGVHFNAKGLKAHGELWAKKVIDHLDKTLRADSPPLQP